ncbi:MAG: hypothetical protein JXC36_02840 [Candidatus Atribacteria bacterium]|nr:hypothetical protein [Candidatus Atribacteria bacterium]
MNKIPINIWINESRYQQLCQSGLEGMTKEVLAGMKVLQIFCTEEQKDLLLKRYPQAKYDQSTTKSIELLPAEFKENLFNRIVEKKSLDVITELL